MTGGMSTSRIKILPGDWWFLRTPQIPLPVAGETTSASPDMRDRFAPHPDRKQVSLAGIAERAARLCWRLKSMQLAGVSGLFADATPSAAELRLPKNRQSDLRGLLNVNPGKEWTERIGLAGKRWTPDFVLKLAARRDVGQVQVHVLDWAAMMTWVTLHQGQIPPGHVPADCYYYSAAALFLCRKISSRTRSSDNTLTENGTVELLTDYLACDGTLLSQMAIEETRLLVRLEHAQLLARAEAFSDRVQKTLTTWGVPL